MITGVYEILNTANGKRYIGSSVDMTRRQRIHWGHLAQAKHHSSPLQHAWNKYGAGAFKFRPILVCQKSMLLFYEQQLLDKVKPEYNVSPTAGSALGVKRSVKFCDALRRRRGEKRSPEARANMRAAQLGKKQPPAQVAKRAAAMMGNRNCVGLKHTPEHDQRRATNRNLSFRGQSFCIAEWARRLGIKQRTIQMRLVQGWSPAQALGTPTLIRGQWSKKGRHGQHKDFQ